MSFFEKLGGFLSRQLRIFCPPLHAAVFSAPTQQRLLKTVLAFLGGCMLGQMYYHYLVKRIPFPHNSGEVFGAILSVLVGVGNVVAMPIRCISLLMFPLSCGKPGRGVLKAVILTYVVAGPITNLGLNAKEVVRVFACTNELSHNLSRTRYAIVAAPFRRAMVGLDEEVGEVADTLRSIRGVVAPIESEIEGREEVRYLKEHSDLFDNLLREHLRSDTVEARYRPSESDDEKTYYQKKYLKKMQYRCENQLTGGVSTCLRIFADSLEECQEQFPDYAAAALCWPLQVTQLCNVVDLVGGRGICDSRRQVDPGLGEGYVYLKKSKENLMKDNDVKLQYKASSDDMLKDFQSAKETGQLVMHAFSEKHLIMQRVMVVVNVCVALLFWRIVFSAVGYHERFLTSIEFDNVYVTDYFKRIDERRRRRRQFSLLPLKKMERSRYIDTQDIKSTIVERQKLFAQILKVMLEVVTATTFVMLDRLFYEALDVVRQHAESDTSQNSSQDLQIEITGDGCVARLFRRVVASLSASPAAARHVSRACAPRPRLMPAAYFLRIYAAHALCVLLLFCDAYSLSLRRLICSYFYPRREKQRILHLYNDILKKRMKMPKTLRKKAVQAVRAYYLRCSENLLSVRMRFPRLLGWLRLLPAARMTCLICGEAEPMNCSLYDCAFWSKTERECGATTPDNWHRCHNTKCPFIYCDECWCEIVSSCLACDPSLVELSDVDSLSEDEVPRH